LVLFDLRLQSPSDWNPALAGMIEPNAVLPEAENVIAAVYPKHLRALTQCKGETLGSPADGMIVPDVLQAETGAFSSAGASERLYLLDQGACNQSSHSPFTSTLALFSQGSLVAKVDAQGAYEIGNVTDLDQDGKNEFLLGWGNHRAGNSEQNYRLVEFERGTLRERHDFGIVLRDSCDDESNKGSQRVSLVHYSSPDKGKLPAFTRENFEIPCSGAALFKHTSTDASLP
jgi:hypothetical protein